MFEKGRVPWNKGKKLSDIHVAHLSLSHLGIVSRPAKVSICSNCNSEYYKKDGGSRRKTRKYCSVECYSRTRNKPEPKVLRGYAKAEKNGNWAGGTSRAYKTGYYSNEYKKWRKSVFERDNFTCLDCGKHGGYLTAHHVKSFSKYPDLRFELDNGHTLCEPCHSKTDNYKCKAKKEILI